MKKALDKKVKYIVAGLLLFIVINVALTYAYIRGETVGSESMSTISFKAGNVSVRYENNSGDIIFSDIIPGFETVKSFSLTSNFGENRQYYEGGMWYQIALAVDKNEFDDNSFYCSISPDVASDKDGILAQVENIGIPSGVNQIGVAIAAGKFDNNNKTHVYNMTISFPNTGEKQDHLENCEFQAHIILKEPKLVNLSFNLDGGYFTTIKLDKASNLKVSENSKFVLPTPIKEGYSFTDWEVIDGVVNLNENILDVKTSNITVKANYKVQSFADDSWEQIAFNVRNGSIDGYKIGETREITLNGLTNTSDKPTFTVRIANKQTPETCNQEGFSQTACGFVLEFVDIITNRQMNPTDTNVGGWPATTMYAYLNEYILGTFPVDLKNVIINTYVVSGHGSTSGEANFISTDKLYLLSTKEVWGSTSNDTVQATRQLEYYGQNGVTISNYSAAIKKQAGNSIRWWLRSANSGGNNCFDIVDTNGSFYGGYGASNSVPTVSPAFRIG